MSQEPRIDDQLPELKETGKCRIVSYPTGDEGFHTGRLRFKVVCLTCRRVAHDNTTGPDIMARAHVDGEDHYGRALDERDIGWLCDRLAEHRDRIATLELALQGIETEDGR